MEHVQYGLLESIEDHHWWFVSLRELLSQILRRQLPSKSVGCCLDAGCGTGANLRMLRDEFHPRSLLGFDCSPLAIDATQRKCPEAKVYVDDIRHPTVPESPLDAMLSIDVLYAAGLQESYTGLRSLVDRLTPGGVCILHFPAYQWLRSYHDDAMHTRERSTAKEAENYTRSLGLEIVLLSYRIHFLFPLVVLKRGLEKLRTRQDSSHSDLQLPNSVVNRCLLAISRLENRLILRGWFLPFGSSVIVVGKRPLQDARQSNQSKG